MKIKFKEDIEIENYTKETFNSDSKMFYRGITLNQHQLNLFKRAKERTPIKNAPKKELENSYNFFIRTTIDQLKYSLEFVLKEQLESNYIKKQHIPAGGGNISKAIFEKTMEDEYGGIGDVVIQKRNEKIKIFKVYSFGKNSNLMKNCPQRKKKGKIFINNQQWVASYIRWSFESIKFYFNVENGLIECSYQIKSEVYLNNKWIESI